MGNGTFLNNAWYRRLKFIALVVLPALGSLYFGLAQIWGLPKAGEVVGSITVIDTFLGLILKAAEAQYDKSDAKYDGIVELETGTDGSEHMFLRQYPGRTTSIDLNQRKELLFKVEV